MSALMKKHPTEKVAKIVWHGGLYALPVDILEHYKVSDEDRDDYVSVDDLFSDLTSTVGEPAVLLKGLRYREGLTQVEFAKRLRVSQTNLSAMEHGRRSIGKELAKRIEEVFGVSYKAFL